MTTKKQVAQEQTFTNPITGLIHVTGEHDTGKTVFALSCGVQPARMVFVDDDIKGRATVNQLRAQGMEFGKYVDLTAAFREKREIERHEIGLKLINDIEPGQYDAIIWDTWSNFEATFYPVVAKDPKRFREFYAPMGQIASGERWAVSFQYEAQVIGDLLNRVPLVILTTHLKNENVNGKQTGRMIPDAKKTLNQKSNFRVWLRHNPDGPEPIGLVLKRPVKLVANEHGLHPVNILPRKMKPFTWERILHYWNEPVGNRPMTADEKPDEYELSILDGVLTSDQKNILKLAIIESERERAEGFSVEPDYAEAVRAKRAEGMDDEDIAESLSLNYAQIKAVK